MLLTCCLLDSGTGLARYAGAAGAPSSAAAASLALRLAAAVASRTANENGAAAAASAARACERERLPRRACSESMRASLRMHMHLIRDAGLFSLWGAHSHTYLACSTSA